MSWNGSDHVGAASSPHQENGGKLHSSTPHFNSKALVAGLIVVLIGGLAIWLILGRVQTSDVPQDAKAKPTQIKQVTPAPAPRAVTAKVETLKTEEKDTRPTYRDERGILRYEGGMRVSGQRPVAKPVDVWANKPKIFKHDAEDTIADFVRMRPGDPVIGDLTYGPEFVKSFKEALLDPTFVLEKDDDETKELKKAVADIVSDLNARMKAGEDIAKILTDTRKEYQVLGQYRHELEVQLHEIWESSEGFTDQDLADFTAAANEMLRGKDLPPLKLPRAVALSLKMKGMKK